MKCKNKRTIFNLFDVLDCRDCEKHLQDEDFDIGGMGIHVYRIHVGCEEVKMSAVEVAFSKKLKLFLKDAIYHQKDNLVFLWENEFDIESIGDDIYDLLSFDEDAHILVSY